MESTERGAAEGTVVEAQSRFRESAERLAVRLRWLSIAAIPVLAYLGDEPVREPWFSGLLASAAVYNLTVTVALARGRRSAGLSIGTALVDSVYLSLLAYLSGGIHSVITIYCYLAITSVCMRLPIVPVVGIGCAYAAELSFLSWLGGEGLDSQLMVKVGYIFLTVAFISPLVHEARARFAEVLAGHEAQRKLLHRLLRTGEDERRRIAGELHDRGGGALFSMLHGLRRLRELVQPSDLASAGEIDRLIRATEGTVHDLRTLIADLRPRLLDDLGLAEALRELLSRERALSGLPVSFQVDAEELPDAERALALYRVVQEAFTNIRRHSQATAAFVSLGRDDGGWGLAIEDDGVGLNGYRRGLGLRTMRERIEALGGHFEITSIAGAGTKIFAWVPEPGSSGEGDVDSSLSRG